MSEKELIAEFELAFGKTPIDEFAKLEYADMKKIFMNEYENAANIENIIEITRNALNNGVALAVGCGGEYYIK